MHPRYYVPRRMQNCIGFHSAKLTQKGLKKNRKGNLSHVVDTEIFNLIITDNSLQIMAYSDETGGIQHVKPRGMVLGMEAGTGALVGGARPRWEQVGHGRSGNYLKRPTYSSSGSQDTD